MNREFDRGAARNELVRLLKGVDQYRGWRLRILQRDYPEADQGSLGGMVVAPSSFWLGIFDDAKGRAYSQVLDQVWNWYTATAEELAYFSSLSVDDRDEVAGFLENFRETLGFSLHSEAGFSRKLIARVLERGRIQDEREYYLLVELEQSDALPLNEQGQWAALAALLRDFEEKAG